MLGAVVETIISQGEFSPPDPLRFDLVASEMPPTRMPKWVIYLQLSTVREDLTGWICPPVVDT